jgi:hypothetical protein
VKKPTFQGPSDNGLREFCIHDSAITNGGFGLYQEHARPSVFTTVNVVSLNDGKFFRDDKDKKIKHKRRKIPSINKIPDLVVVLEVKNYSNLFRYKW